MNKCKKFMNKMLTEEEIETIQETGCESGVNGLIYAEDILRQYQELDLNCNGLIYAEDISKIYDKYPNEIWEIVGDDFSKKSMAKSKSRDEFTQMMFWAAIDFIYKCEGDGEQNE